MPKLTAEEKEAFRENLKRENNKHQARKNKDSPTRGTLIHRKPNLVKCGAKTKHGTTCAQPAGFGTQHLGIGKCKYHGGNTKANIGHAAKEQARLMGAPREMNPLDALLWCMSITAGEIDWLTERMAELKEADYTELDQFGVKQLHLWGRERRDRVEMLAKFSAQAVQLGLTERSIKLAETYGAMIAMMLKSIFDRLGLSKRQQAIAPRIVQETLIQIEKEQTDMRALLPAPPIEGNGSRK